MHIREIVFSARELEDRRNNPESFAKEEYKRRYHQMVYNVYKIILEKKTEDQIEKEFPISFISGKKKKKKYDKEKDIFLESKMHKEIITNFKAQNTSFSRKNQTNSSPKQRRTFRRQIRNRK